MGHLIRVKAGNNNLVFIADTGSPTSFVNNKIATASQNSVKNARRIQLEIKMKRTGWCATAGTKHYLLEGLSPQLHQEAGHSTPHP